MPRPRRRDAKLGAAAARARPAAACPCTSPRSRARWSRRSPPTLPAPRAAARCAALLVPALTAGCSALGERGGMLRPAAAQHGQPTIVRGGSKANVIPDDRLASSSTAGCSPGSSPSELLAELRALAGVERRVRGRPRTTRVAAEPDLALFDTARRTSLRELDPAAKPIPMLLPGVTDGRFFARARHPDVRLPADAAAAEPAVHAADPRRRRAPPGRRARVRHERDRACARALLSGAGPSRSAPSCSRVLTRSDQNTKLAAQPV